MVLVAAVLTLLFKRDKDVIEFESTLGKMKEADADVTPANSGKCCTRALLLQSTTHSYNARIMYSYIRA